MQELAAEMFERLAAEGVNVTPFDAVRIDTAARLLARAKASDGAPFLSAPRVRFCGGAGSSLRGSCCLPCCSCFCCSARASSGSICPRRGNIPCAVSMLRIIRGKWTGRSLQNRALPLHS